VANLACEQSTGVDLLTMSIQNWLELPNGRTRLSTWSEARRQTTSSRC